MTARSVAKMERLHEKHGPLCAVLYALSNSDRLEIMRFLHTSGPVRPDALPVQVKVNALTAHLDVLESAGLITRSGNTRSRKVEWNVGEFSPLVELVLSWATV